MSRLTLLVLTLLVLPRVGAAQLPDLPTFGPNWVDFSYPKLFYGAQEGLTVGLYYAQVRPVVPTNGRWLAIRSLARRGATGTPKLLRNRE